MKLITLALVALFSFSTFAGISLDIDFKNNENGKKIELKKKLEVYLDEVTTLKIPNSNKIVEIKVTDKVPEVLSNGEKFDDQLLIDLKVVEVTGKNRKTISSPKIITIIGKEATMETYEDESRKTAIMSLKIKPTRI
ncbi:MAG: hypothetical protein HON90_17090 [Halobacteriovoraceae bacterium]|jgi:hypothetical protein|nr:hypothetical protein [Halobacteriovoraceae bacterium]